MPVATKRKLESDDGVSDFAPSPKATKVSRPRKDASAKAVARRERMERNRIAAQESRDRKKSEHERLQARVDELEAALSTRAASRSPTMSVVTFDPSADDRIRVLEAENAALRDQLAAITAHLGLSSPVASSSTSGSIAQSESTAPTSPVFTSPTGSYPFDLDPTTTSFNDLLSSDPLVLDSTSSSSLPSMMAGTDSATTPTHPLVAADSVGVAPSSIPTTIVSNEPLPTEVSTATSSFTDFDFDFTSLTSSLWSTNESVADNGGAMDTFPDFGLETAAATHLPIAVGLDDYFDF